MKITRIAFSGAMIQIGFRGPSVGGDGFRITCRLVHLHDVLYRLKPSAWTTKSDNPRNQVILSANCKMSATITETTTPLKVVATSQALKVDGTDPKYGDWRDDLVRDGFAVIKGAIPKERAEKYADAMFGWLEGL